MKGNFKITKLMVKEHIFLVIKENMKDFGKIIKWKEKNDGRIYDGNWKNGKQDGEGKFFNPKKNEWKKGIWEDGKRIKWID